MIASCARGLPWPGGHGRLLVACLAAAACSISAAATTISISGAPASGAFGSAVVILPNGNVVVTDPSFDLPDGTPDVGAVHVTLEARLTVDDPSRRDDRERALYLIHVGADYYPEKNVDVSAFAPMGFNPGVGVSRAKRVRSDWQSFSFTTVNVGSVEANGSAMNEAELRADPPPMR